MYYRSKEKYKKNSSQLLKRFVTTIKISFFTTVKKLSHKYKKNFSEL